MKKTKKTMYFSHTPPRGFSYKLYKGVDPLLLAHKLYEYILSIEIEENIKWINKNPF